MTTEREVLGAETEGSQSTLVGQDWGAETAAPEISKEEFEKIQTELEAEKQRTRSLQGRLDNRQSQSESFALRSEVGVLAESMRQIRLSQIRQDVDLDPEERAQELAKVEQERQKSHQQQQRDADAAVLIQHSADLVGSINELIDEAIEAGVDISMETPFVKQASEDWANQTSAAGLNDVYRKLIKGIVGKVTAQSKTLAEKQHKESEEDRQRENRENGTMALGAPGGRAAGRPRDDFVNVSPGELFSRHLTSER